MDLVLSRECVSCCDSAEAGLEMGASDRADLRSDIFGHAAAPVKTVDRTALPISGAVAVAFL
jgi:hypothetical protein